MGGIDVETAGQHQSLHALQKLPRLFAVSNEGQDDGKSAVLRDQRDVIGIQGVLALPVDDRERGSDSNDGSRHQ